VCPNCETLTQERNLEDEHSKVEWRRIANPLLSARSGAASTPWDPLPIQLLNPFLSSFHSLFLSPHPVTGNNPFSFRPFSILTRNSISRVYLSEILYIISHWFETHSGLSTFSGILFSPFKLLRWLGVNGVELKWWVGLFFIFSLRGVCVLIFLRYRFLVVLLNVV